MLYFVTGNAGKLREFKAQIPHIEQLKLDVDEIQSLDPQTVIAHKLAQAAAQHDGELVVEDTSLCLNALGGLPGTYIKWFLETIGPTGIGELANKYPDPSAVARTVIGYRDQAGECRYFTGEISGRIVPPQGSGGFGWDSVFIPEGHDQTFAELGPEVKSQMSMRYQAIKQLKAYLEAQS